MPAFITLEEAKQQLNIDASDTLDDNYITALIPAASEIIERECNRKIYLTQEALDADNESPEYAMVLNDTLKLACKLTIGHWFNNREATSELTIKKVPLSYEHLINLYRIPFA